MPWRYHSLLPGEPAQLITTDDELQKYINVWFSLPGEEGTVEKACRLQCDNIHTSQWSYIIDECTVGNHSEQFLNNVPPDKVKHWIIIKTSTLLKIVCNKVTVLNFNFATDYSPGYENQHQIWSKRCTALSCYTSCQDLLLLKTVNQ